MKNKEIVEYINSIDFSLVNEHTVLENIYREIGDAGAALATDPYAVTNLERLVLATSADLLVVFMKSLGPKTIYKKLGSRIVESIFKRLFECMYARGEHFALEDVAELVDAEACVNCRNATHALRQLIMLLAGKRIDGKKVTKYPLPGASSGGADSAECHSARRTNAEYSKDKLAEYKAVFEKCMDDIAENDSFATLLVFLQCTKSQSLIGRLIEKDCFPENIKERGYVYEAIPPIANRKNKDIIYERIKKSIMGLSTDCRSSYFIQSFLRASDKGLKIYRRIIFNKFEKNSNVILSLLESLQKSRCYEEVAVLVEKFYEMENSLFSSMLLGKDDGLDTKYADAVVNFMGMPKKYGYGVNEDFCRLFSPAWLSSRAGRKLLAGFVNGSSSSDAKIEFLDARIELFWSCTRWREGKAFVRSLTEFTSGHARKKAFEIHARFK